jgi:hypothetical protein
MKRVLMIDREPRQLLEAAGCELIEMKDADKCCGMSGLFGVKYAELSMPILEQKINDIRDTGAEIAACACSGCMVQLQGGLDKQLPGVKMKHVADILAEANEMRDWHIYADFAHHLIGIARKLYQKEPLAVELKNTVYALDATTIDLCLSIFPWARFRETKGAVRLHTLLDLRGNIPSFIYISDGKLHEVNVLDIIPLEAGAFYIMDRGFLDFSRLHAITRAKSNLKSRRLYSHPVDKSTGVVCDQSIILTVSKSVGDYPDKLRRVRYYDAETGKNLVFLTNNFLLPAITFAQVYKQRWQVELFFKWIKQHLRIKSFYGTSENAVKTQIWIAISVYLIVAIIKKRLNIQESLYTILQVLSVSLFERTSMFQLLTFYDYINDMDNNLNQLNLFTDYSGHW